MKLAEIKRLHVDSGFAWTGGNSHRDRTNAGAELAQYLRRLTARAPATQIVILAHSHGGNVALYAMADRQVATTVRAIICMNTPFVHVRARGVSGLDNSVRAGCALTWFVSALLLSASEVAIPPLIFFSGVFVVWCLATRSGKVARWAADRQESILKELRLPPYDGFIYTLGSRSDEVLRWLGIVNAVSSVPFRAWSLLTPYPLAAAGTVLLAGLVAWLIAALLSLSSGGIVEDGSPLAAITDRLLYAGAIASGGAVACACVLIASLLIVSVGYPLMHKVVRDSPIGYGETLVDNLLVEIVGIPERPHGTSGASDSVGWQHWGQRHFAYAEPLAVRKIVHFLRRYTDSAQEHAGGA